MCRSRRHRVESELAIRAHRPRRCGSLGRTLAPPAPRDSQMARCFSRTPMVRSPQRLELLALTWRREAPTVALARPVQQRRDLRLRRRIGRPIVAHLRVRPVQQRVGPQPRHHLPERRLLRPRTPCGLVSPRAGQQLDRRTAIPWCELRLRIPDRPLHLALFQARVSDLMAGGPGKPCGASPSPSPCARPNRRRTMSLKSRIGSYTRRKATTGTRRSPRSRSTSETDCPNNPAWPHPQKHGQSHYDT